jgi:hypothetical protein
MALKLENLLAIIEESIYALKDRQEAQQKAQEAIKEKIAQQEKEAAFAELEKLKALLAKQ